MVARDAAKANVLEGPFHCRPKRLKTRSNRWRRCEPRCSRWRVDSCRRQAAFLSPHIIMETSPKWISEEGKAGRVLQPRWASLLQLLVLPAILACMLGRVPHEIDVSKSTSSSAAPSPMLVPSSTRTRGHGRPDDSHADQARIGKRMREDSSKGAEGTATAVTARPPPSFLPPASHSHIPDEIPASMIEAASHAEFGSQSEAGAASVKSPAAEPKLAP